MENKLRTCISNKDFVNYNNQYNECQIRTIYMYLMYYTSVDQGQEVLSPHSLECCQVALKLLCFSSTHPWTDSNTELTSSVGLKLKNINKQLIEITMDHHLKKVNEIYLLH